jgi:hypothetical protein
MVPSQVPFRGTSLPGRCASRENLYPSRSNRSWRMTFLKKSVAIGDQPTFPARLAATAMLRKPVFFLKSGRWLFVSLSTRV